MQNVMHQNIQQTFRGDCRLEFGNHLLIFCTIDYFKDQRHWYFYIYEQYIHWWIHLVLFLSFLWTFRRICCQIIVSTLTSGVAPSPPPQPASRNQEIFAQFYIFILLFVNGVIGESLEFLCLKEVILFTKIIFISA